MTRTKHAAQSAPQRKRREVSHDKGERKKHESTFRVYRVQFDPIVPSKARTTFSLASGAEMYVLVPSVGVLSSLVA